MPKPKKPGEPSESQSERRENKIFTSLREARKARLERGPAKNQQVYLVPMSGYDLYVLSIGPDDAAGIVSISLGHIALPKNVTCEKDSQSAADQMAEDHEKRARKLLYDRKITRE